MNKTIDLLINKIISLLSPFRNTYPDEINTITNDLINYQFDSLNLFIDTHFKDLNYSNEIKDFIKSLVSKDLIDSSYLNKIDNNQITFIPFKESSILKVSTRPLNVKENVLNKIKSNTQPPELVKVNHEYVHVDFKTQSTEKPNFTKDDIDALRQKIIEAQLNYINNANKFIQSLEQVDTNTLYDSLIELNDIRFIQHSLSKLSDTTLNRLLPYVENKLNNNKHSSIDMFIIEVIKKMFT